MPPVDPRSYTPKFIQIADSLRGRIASDYEPGDYLPSERDLAHEYETSPLTVRRALRALRTERLIRTVQGTRAQVREIGERAVEHLNSVVRIICRPATADEQRELDLGDGEPVYVVTGRDGTERVLPAYETEFQGDGED